MPVFVGFTAGSLRCCLQVWQVSWAHPKFGHLLASCSFDRKVRSQLFLDAGLTFGWLLLALADGTQTLMRCASPRVQVIIWKEMSENQWRPIFTAALEASVNSVAWAPHEIGLVLAAGACREGSLRKEQSAFNCSAQQATAQNSESELRFFSPSRELGRRHHSDLALIGERAVGDGEGTPSPLAWS